MFKRGIMIYCAPIASPLDLPLSPPSHSVEHAFSHSHITVILRKARMQVN